jgi:hypothetical protein
VDRLSTARTRVLVPPLPDALVVGGLRNILLAGIRRNPRVELVDDAAAADFVLLDFRHILDRHPLRTDPDRTIIVDYRDPVEPLLAHDAAWYFKRSVVDQVERRFCDYDRPVTPISYCVKDDYLDRGSSVARTRDIDISVFFDPQSDAAARNLYRSRVACVVRDQYRHRRVFVGIAGSAGALGRNSFQAPYFEMMARSKIVVTCNPDRWEGDYRLFEAISSGALVITDEMLTPVVHPFIDHQHLVVYDRNDLSTLTSAIDQMLDDEGLRSAIAQRGYEHAMRHHTTTNRIDEILDTVGSHSNRP